MGFVEKISESKLWKLLLSIQRLVMVVSTVTVVITLALVVLARHVFHYNFLGYNEVIIIAAFWMYFIGSAYGSWEESHITADILSQFVSAKSKIILGIISKIIQIVISIPMVYLAIQMLQFNLKMNPVTLDLQIPLAFPQSAILICFVLMIFYSMVYLMRDINALKQVNKINNNEFDKKI